MIAVVVVVALDFVGEMSMSVTSSTMHHAVRRGLLMEAHACENALFVCIYSGLLAMMAGMRNKCKGLWCALIHKQILTWNAELDGMLYCYQCACCLDIMQGSTNSPAPTVKKQHHCPGVTCRAGLKRKLVRHRQAPSNIAAGLLVLTCWTLAMHWPRQWWHVPWPQNKA